MKLPDFSTAYKNRKIAHLKEEHARGHALTQDEMDSIHLDITSRENLAYWKAQVQGASDNDTARIEYCQAHVRNMCANLHALEVKPENEHPFGDLLEEILTTASVLPAVH